MALIFNIRIKQPAKICFILSFTCICLVDLFVLQAQTKGTSPSNVSRPNVIFILSDDQGVSDLNCYGSKDLVTPNIDRLAANGVRFSQFYAAAPVCSPSRAALLTGRYPQRAGLTGNASSTEGVAGMPAE